MGVHRPPTMGRIGTVNRGCRGLDEVQDAGVRLEGEICDELAFRCVNSQNQFAFGRVNPDTPQPCMRDEQFTTLGYRETVRSDSSGELNKPPYFDRPTIATEWYSPNTVVPSRREKYRTFLQIHDQPVRAGNVGQQAIQFATSAQTEKPSRRVVQARESLIREVQVTVAGEEEVIEGLETVDAVAFEQCTQLPALSVIDHDPVLVIRDEDATVGVNLEAVRPPVILQFDTELTRRAPSQHASIDNIHEPECAVGVEAGAFQEAGGPKPCGLRSVPARFKVTVPQFVWEPQDKLSLGSWWHWVEHEDWLDQGRVRIVAGRFFHGRSPGSTAKDPLALATITSVLGSSTSGSKSARKWLELLTTKIFMSSG